MALISSTSKIYHGANSYSAFGATVYTAGLKGVMERFGVSMTVSILGLSLYLWGIAFAPIHTPHLSERFGRTPVYMVSLPIFSLFILGASFSQSFSALAVCRFFAGLTGGPCLVLIEGTFADVWTADVTVTYYACLTLASFIGAGAGPLVGGFVFAYGSWRWTQWITLILALGALLLGVSMPETYGREILRRRHKRNSTGVKLPAAQSGVTLAQMSKITIFNPIKMLVTEPLVILLSLNVGFIFAVIFQFFISIPAVLSLTYGFTIYQAGLAFIAAIAGALLAAVTATIIDKLTFARVAKKSLNTIVPIELRMIPGIVGSVLITASLFWIAWTASPRVHFLIPIFGTLVFIWGCALVLTSAISYLFDAYPPAGTLSALTAAACFRLVLAGLIPLVIIQMIMGLGGAWAVSTFGFISAALILIPIVVLVFGAKLRARSRYNGMTMGMMGQGAWPKDEEMEMH